MLDDDIVEAAKRLLDICKRKNLTVATAESCTAGLVAGTLTEIPGVSSILDRGFITYSNQAKQDMLGVSAATLKVYGAVSRETAEEMARGVLAHAPVDLAVSVTGIAGPDGGSAEKPVGLVHFGAAARGGQAGSRREALRQYRAGRGAQAISAAGLPHAARSSGRRRLRALPEPNWSRIAFRRFHRRVSRTLPQSGGMRCRTSRPSACRACGCETRRR